MNEDWNGEFSRETVWVEIHQGVNKGPATGISHASSLPGLFYWAPNFLASAK